MLIYVGVCQNLATTCRCLSTGYPDVVISVTSVITVCDVYIMINSLPCLSPCVVETVN